ncbi:MAG: hypothetical protein ABSF43_12695 [Rectinemataceae bacterium]|jgi:hypothetical protein
MANNRCELAIMSRIGYTAFMIGFCVKKAFFDGWDNLFSLILLNLGFILALAIGFVLPSSLGFPVWASIALGVLSLAAGSVWWSTTVFAMREVADFRSFHLRDVGANIKQALAPGLQVGALLVLGWFVISVGLPFYFSIGGLLGSLAAGVIFWCAVILLLALQYYIPLRARLGGGLRKNLRKSFVMFFDNPGFSIFLFFSCAATLVISFFLAFLLPGFAGIALSQDVALRLRLYKYDWLEANPKGNRRSIPWDELLVEDKELVGKRTLKGMFFPWKE